MTQNHWHRADMGVCACQRWRLLSFVSSVLPILMLRLPPREVSMALQFPAEARAPHSLPWAWSTIFTSSYLLCARHPSRPEGRKDLVLASWCMQCKHEEFRICGKSYRGIQPLKPLKKVPPRPLIHVAGIWTHLCQKLCLVPVQWGTGRCIPGFMTSSIWAALRMTLQIKPHSGKKVSWVSRSQLDCGQIRMSWKLCLPWTSWTEQPCPRDAVWAQVACAGTLPASLSLILSTCGITSSQGWGQSSPKQEEDQLPLPTSQESDGTGLEHTISAIPKLSDLKQWFNCSWFCKLSLGSLAGHLCGCI